MTSACGSFSLKIAASSAWIATIQAKPQRRWCGLYLWWLTGQSDVWCQKISRFYRKGNLVPGSYLVCTLHYHEFDRGRWRRRCSTTNVTVKDKPYDRAVYTVLVCLQAEYIMFVFSLFLFANLSKETAPGSRCELLAAPNCKNVRKSSLARPLL